MADCLSTEYNLAKWPDQAYVLRVKNSRPESSEQAWSIASFHGRFSAGMPRLALPTFCEKKFC